MIPLRVIIVDLAKIRQKLGIGGRFAGVGTTNAVYNLMARYITGKQTEFLNCENFCFITYAKKNINRLCGP